MPLFRRRPAAPPEVLPLVRPAPDGSTWTAAAERPSFEASTYYEMAGRRAYEPDAHALAGGLVEAALPRLDTGVSAEDAPYLRKVFLTAARLGTGLGLVDPSPPGLVDPGVAGALGVARRGLPAMQPEWALLGAWFVLAGHWLARQDGARRDEAVQELVALL